MEKSVFTTSPLSTWFTYRDCLQVSMRTGLSAVPVTKSLQTVCRSSAGLAAWWGSQECGLTSVTCPRCSAVLTGGAKLGSSARRWLLSSGCSHAEHIACVSAVKVEKFGNEFVRYTVGVSDHFLQSDRRSFPHVYRTETNSTAAPLLG
ncbi:hypothetical protein Q8A73_023326 [Channa argus]|nr:hypothetical protein Q8A73_023326 [Channa argus]